MAFFHVLLSGSGSSGDGSTWDDASDGTSAFIGGAGFGSAISGAAAGDTIYVKGAESTSTSVSLAGPTTLAAFRNPIKVIGVKTGTTNLDSSIVQSDLIPGVRTGQSTRAYDWGGGTVPSITLTGTTADISINGAVNYYAIIFIGVDNIDFGTVQSEVSFKEECEFIVSGSVDELKFGLTNVARWKEMRFTRCRFQSSSTGGLFKFIGSGLLEFMECEIDSADTTNAIILTQYKGTTRFFSCDFSGSEPTPIVGIDNFLQGEIEFWNCKFPASHALTGGTAAAAFRVANYGSDDQTGLTTGGSEQQLEIHTDQGTVDVETTAVRTGGADDGAAGGFSWAMTPNNVTDNVVGVVSPWMYIWVAGDTTAKTLTVFIANAAAESAANNIETDEAYLEVGFPSESGTSMYDYLPNDGAAGDGGGRMQLLGSAADLTATSETWGSGGNNDQKFSQAIAPDYEGALYCRVHYSKSGGPVLYVDPKPEIT